MAAYGRGQMLGVGIDPRLMSVDYSPFVDAAATTARSNAALASSIGGTIEKGVNQFTDYKKQQAEDERLVQKSKSVAKAIGDLIPDLQPTIQESMMILDNKEVPLSRRKAEAEAISDILNLGINEVRNRQEIGIKQRELGVREAANIAEMTQLDRDYQNKANQRQAKAVKVGEFDVAVVEDGFGNIYDPVTDRPITNLAAFALNRDDFGPVGLPQDGMVLPPREFPDGVPTDGVPIPPADFDYNQMPMLPEDRLVAPETVQAIEAAAAPRVIPRTSAQASTPTFRPATPEEAALRGASAGQIDESTGRFYPAPQAQGRTTRFNTETNQFEIIEGVDNREALKEQKAQQAKESLVDQNMQDLYFLEDRTRDMAPGVTGAAGRVISEKVFATKQAENKAIIDRISSRLTLGTLQSMRENSPTGGALGNVSDKDIEILRNAATSLSNAQSPEEFDRELIRLQNLQYDSIHGSEDLLKKKLKSGEITQDQFNSVQANRPVRFLGGRGQIMSRDTQPSQKPSIGLTPEEKKILDKY